MTAEALANGVARVASSTFVLYLRTHACHWNVVGTGFVGLHALFGEQYEELHDAVDDLMERVRALGMPAPSSIASILTLSTVEDISAPANAQAMVASLLQGNEQMTRTCRPLFKAADQAGDQATCDLLAQRMRAHEKAAWKLRALLA